LQRRTRKRGDGELKKRRKEKKEEGGEGKEH